ncbi:MAG: MoaD/ThiS family protein, partial [Chloroflexota bacterium]|nr:MoaD/ThiS family protein [Chloroflexota bacterium]
MSAAQPLPAPGVRVRVRLFAIQRELAGVRELDLELPAGANIEDAWTALVERHPVLAPGRPSVRFARNGVYAEPGARLGDGDELACIPPVSGGDGSEDDPLDEGRRILEIREAPFDSSILAQLGDR